MMICFLSSTNDAITTENNVFFIVPFNGVSQVTFDPNNWHSDINNSTRICPETIGTFRLTASVTFNDNNYGERIGIQFFKNGNSIVMGNFPNSLSGRRSATYTCITETSSTFDYFELGVLQDSGSSLSLNNFHFQVERLF